MPSFRNSLGEMNPGQPWETTLDPIQNNALKVVNLDI